MICLYSCSKVLDICALFVVNWWIFLMCLSYHHGRSSKFLKRASKIAEGFSSNWRARPCDHHRRFGGCSKWNSETAKVSSSDRRVCPSDHTCLFGGCPKRTSETTEGFSLDWRACPSDHHRRSSRCAKWASETVEGFSLDQRACPSDHHQRSSGCAKRASETVEGFSFKSETARWGANTCRDFALSSKPLMKIWYMLIDGLKFEPCNAEFNISFYWWGSKHNADRSSQKLYFFPEIRLLVYQYPYIHVNILGWLDMLWCACDDSIRFIDKRLWKFPSKLFI